MAKHCVWKKKIHLDLTCEAWSYVTTYRTHFHSKSHEKVSPPLIFLYSCYILILTVRITLYWHTHCVWQKRFYLDLTCEAWRYVTISDTFPWP